MTRITSAIWFILASLTHKFNNKIIKLKFNKEQKSCFNDFVRFKTCSDAVFLHNLLYLFNYRWSLSQETIKIKINLKLLRHLILRAIIVSSEHILNAVWQEAFKLMTVMVINMVECSEKYAENAIDNHHLWQHHIL